MKLSRPHKVHNKRQQCHKHKVYTSSRKYFRPTRIYGTGIDIAHIPRFHQTIEKFNEKFYRKALHPKEIEQINQLEEPNEKAVFLASRWAFKEALVKVRYMFYKLCIYI